MYTAQYQSLETFYTLQCTCDILQKNQHPFLLKVKSSQTLQFTSGAMLSFQKHTNPDF